MKSLTGTDKRPPIRNSITLEKKFFLMISKVLKRLKRGKNEREEGGLMQMKMLH
jgi:hypothetical protein